LKKGQNNYNFHLNSAFWLTILSEHGIEYLSDVFHYQLGLL